MPKPEVLDWKLYIGCKGGAPTTEPSCASRMPILSEMLTALQMFTGNPQTMQLKQHTLDNIKHTQCQSTTLPTPWTQLSGRATHIHTPFMYWWVNFQGTHTLNRKKSQASYCEVAHLIDIHQTLFLAEGWDQGMTLCILLGKIVSFKWLIGGEGCLVGPVDVGSHASPEQFGTLYTFWESVFLKPSESWYNHNLKQAAAL